MNKQDYNEEKETMENKPLDSEEISEGEQAENNSTEINREKDNKQDENAEADIKGEDSDIGRIKLQLENKTKECEEYFGRLQRVAAEFDNFKKRTLKEKEALYSEAVCDVVAAFLPVIDSIDRALEACEGNNGEESIKEGIELIKRQISEVMKKLQIEEIKSLGEKFNPELHNAVMHVEDEKYGQNVVVEEFQKGYKYKDKVIRHSMVKVAN